MSELNAICTTCGNTPRSSSNEQRLKDILASCHRIIRKLGQENAELKAWKEETLYHVPHIDKSKEDANKRIKELEEENARLKDELEKERAVVDFYANFDSWIVHRNRGLLQEIRTIESGDCERHESCGYKLKLGGKRARQRQQERVRDE